MNMSNEHDPLAAYCEHAKRTMFPLMKQSAVSLTLLTDGEPDPKLCIELGAAILFEKPLIVVVMKGAIVPEGLRRAAQKVIEIASLDELSSSGISEAIDEVMAMNFPQRLQT